MKIFKLKYENIQTENMKIWKFEKLIPCWWDKVCESSFLILGYSIILKWRATSNYNVSPIENRIYREELKESLGMNFFSPFQSEREFKVYK